jgi:hypothetical protein
MGPDMTEAAHSELGPSAADRWINCPGSHLASKGKPDRPSKYAAEGSVAHTLASLVFMLDAPAANWKGHVFHQDGFEFKVGKPMIEGVQQFHDWAMRDPGEHFSEVRVRYDNWVPGGFGTSDRITVSRDVCFVRDLKFGTGHEVDPEWNPQLLLYGLGTYNWLRHRYPFKKLVLGIGQPRLRKWAEWEVSLKDLLDWADDVAFPAALRALTPGQPRKAGPWCTFCRIRDTCSTRDEYKREVGRAKNNALVSQHFSAVD